MSEVTAKDLRDELKDLMDSQITEYSQRHYPQECVLMQERIDRFLAAFDKMAQDADRYQRLKRVAEEFGVVHLHTKAHMREFGMSKTGADFMIMDEVTP